MIFSQRSYYFAFNIKWGVAGNNPMLYHKSAPKSKTIAWGKNISQCKDGADFTI